MIELPIIKTLNNRLRIIYTPFPGVDSVSLKLIGRVGGIWEKPDELGAAHYVEHLVFDGTKKYESTQELNSLIEDAGGNFNGGTDFYEVNYIVKLLKEDVEKGFDFLSQLVCHPLFKKSDVDKERGIIIQEYTNSLDEPVSNFMMNSQKYVFPQGHRLSEPLIGNISTLSKISRQQLVDYHQNNYTTDNFVLSVCGDDVKESVFQLAEQYFGGMKTGQMNNYLGYEETGSLVNYVENNENIQQATISIGFPADVKYGRNFFITKYIQQIFGGSFTSRLFDEIRQKRGLAYYASSVYQAYPAYGMFENLAQVEPKNVTEVIKLISTEVKKMCQKGVTEREYNRTKKMIQSYFVFSNEEPEARADLNGLLILEGHEKENIHTIKEKYLAVTINEINEVARELFEQNPKICVLSNHLTRSEVENAWQS